MDGPPVLGVPSDTLRQVRDAVAINWKHQNHNLSHAAQLYTASLADHPGIPTTVFTQNIATLLAKKIRKPPVGGQQEAGEYTSTTTMFTRVSSLSAATSKSSLRGSIAWQQPHLLTETLQYNKVATKNVQTSQAINQASKQNAILVAHMEIPGDTSVDGKASLASKSSTWSRRSRVSRTSS